MKRATRREIKAWLLPMRKAITDLRSGEVDSLRGYPVTRRLADGEYLRIDACLAGFRCMILRIIPGLDIAPLARVENKLFNGVYLTVDEIDAALRVLRRCEDLLVRVPRDRIDACVSTEQIAIELERRGIVEAA